jgi:hypothetical protein
MMNFLPKPKPPCPKPKPSCPKPKPSCPKPKPSCPKSPFSATQRNDELAKIMEKVKASECSNIKKLQHSSILKQPCNKKAIQNELVKNMAKERARKAAKLSYRRPGGLAGDSPGGRGLKICNQSEKARNKKIKDDAVRNYITVEPFDGEIEGVKLPMILESGGNPYTFGNYGGNLESSSRGSRTADIYELPSDVRNRLLSLERKS